MFPVKQIENGWEQILKMFPMKQHKQEVLRVWLNVSRETLLPVCNLFVFIFQDYSFLVWNKYRQLCEAITNNFSAFYT